MSVWRPELSQGCTAGESRPWLAQPQGQCPGIHWWPLPFSVIDLASAHSPLSMDLKKGVWWQKKLVTCIVIITWTRKTVLFLYFPYSLKEAALTWGQPAPFTFKWEPSLLSFWQKKGGGRNKSHHFLHRMISVLCSPSPQYPKLVGLVRGVW